VRWLAVTAGLLLIAVAFAAATQVADTRVGLMAEDITLFTALVGISLILYGMFAGVRLRPRSAQEARADVTSTPPVRARKDLLLGAAGIAAALVLLVGLTASAGIQWAGWGSLMLLPMIAGSVFLCLRFLRAPASDSNLAARRSDPPKQS